MTVTVENCVIKILCSLSETTISALHALLQQYIAQLTAKKALLEAQLLKAHVARIPLETAEGFVQTQIAILRKGLAYVPSNVLTSCTGIDNLKGQISSTLDILLYDFEIITQDLERLLSFGDELNSLIDKITTEILFYQDTLFVLANCDTLNIK